MSNAVDIRILGQNIRLRTEMGEAYARKLASHVEGVMRNIQRNTQNPSSDRTAIMAALHIADELFQLKKQAAQDHQIRLRTYQRLIKASDNPLKEP
jgi:cell division protein ZapA (FtsZ GTPase activity inhibitor)